MRRVRVASPAATHARSARQRGIECSQSRQTPLRPRPRWTVRLTTVAADLVSRAPTPPEPPSVSDRAREKSGLISSTSSQRAGSTCPSPAWARSSHLRFPPQRDLRDPGSRTGRNVGMVARHDAIAAVRAAHGGASLGDVASLKASSRARSQVCSNHTSAALYPI